uniref:Glutamate receptor-interacting protein 2 n=1 Tax=Phallusia mammillata TaxID=59560 RepID=A0A6F9DEN0_9ASCI|nr:glutamate receptor-interacting protein 2 [Phallusia mammillata]
MGSSHSRKTDHERENRAFSFYLRKSSFRGKQSTLKTGSLRRPPAHQVQPKSNLRRWHSATSLNEERHHAMEAEQLQIVPARVEEIPEEERGMCMVKLVKTNALGVTVSGGSDREGRPKVKELRSSGLAAKSDLLQVGDFITEINGIRTSKLKHGEIISLLKNIGERVNLEIEYHLPPTTVQTAHIVQKTTDITLRRSGNDSFGFVLRGGSHDQHCKSRPHVVTHIRKDSPADREGSLKTGDRIVSVGSIKLQSLTLEDSLETIKASPEETTFTIEYDVSVMDAVANASGPLLVEVSKTPGAELGITLTKSTHRKKTVICIDRVKPASISDRCGALHVGDQILSIDNVSMGNGSVSVREASDMLQTASDQVKLEILPVSHLAIASPKQFGQNRFAPFITSAQSMSALNSQRVGRQHLQGSGVSTFGRGSNRFNRKRPPRNKYSASAMSLASTDYLSGNQVVHTEVVEIHLMTSEDGCDPMTSPPTSAGFGIQLQGSVFATEMLGSPPVIGFIEPDSVADRCGVIQAGDRIVSINGFACEDCAIDDVNQMLNEAYCAGQVVMEIEFDVAESVVPSSGTFHAKLGKRRGVDVGIVVSAVHNEDALMISEVKRGSVAHRTGTLEAGDRLLSIDGVRLDDCSAEDAHALLASAEDVVRLKIQKDEENSEDAETAGAITYTVELKRYGGPLGITISGTDEKFDPIVISGLTPGGLASRTGAIHVGDKILSINAVPLRAKTLNEAISLLQNAGEVVNLKIRRRLADIPASNEQQTQDQHRPLEATKPPFATSTIQRNEIRNDPISELSDPEDDILPPPMGPLPEHSPSDKEQRNGSLPKERGVRPGPAGAPSIDSAVESWVDSSADMQHTRSSTGSHHPLGGAVSPSVQMPLFESPKPIRQFSNEWQKNRSSTAPRMQKRGDRSSSSFSKIREKFETGSSSRTYSDTWGKREQMRARNYKSPDRSKTSSIADWQRALDDLQSVGQSGYLQDLESKLTIGTLDRNRPAASYGLRRQTQGGGMYDSVGTGRSEYNSQVPSSPQQLQKLSLIKDHKGDDFGFSMSDGQTDNGVYVHTVRQGGPASRAGVLPYDRILQVNGTSTHEADCRSTIALVDNDQHTLSLLVSRHSANTLPHLARRPVLSPPVSSRATRAADKYPVF